MLVHWLGQIYANLIPLMLVQINYRCNKCDNALINNNVREKICKFVLY